MYVFLHTVKGPPLETPDQGKAQLLTLGTDGLRAPIYLLPQIPQHLSYCTVSPGGGMGDAQVPAIYFMASFYQI